jgi:hypothetical protein
MPIVPTINFSVNKVWNCGSRHPLGNWYGAVAALLDDVHVRTTSRNRHAIRFDSQAYPALYILFLGWKSQFDCFGSGGGLYDDYLKKEAYYSIREWQPPYESESESDGCWHASAMHCTEELLYNTRPNTLCYNAHDDLNTGLLIVNGCHCLLDCAYHTG